jgi:succinate dehydrogenase/fumarate reductase flavoprotein subunit
MQKTHKNCDKELFRVKRQMNKIQHENLNVSNKLKEAKQAARKTKNLQQEYAELNKLN